MCFSPEADVVAGVVLGGLAVDALLRHPRRSDLLLALLPAILAAHSLIEALVWYAERGQVDAWIGQVATYAYLVIAFVVLPIYLPLAILAREPVSRHRRALTALLLLGFVASAVLGAAIMLHPVTVTLEPHFVRYGVTIPAVGLVVTTYVAATCGAGLLSSSFTIRTFAIVNLLAVAALAFVNTVGVTSLWCGWAVVTSVAIVIQIRYDEIHHAVMLQEQSRDPAA